MKYGDFSSVVQLGVGLHVGTALLQIYGEIGLQPLMRVFQRIRALLALSGDAAARAAEMQEIQLEFFDLEREYAVFKIQLFNEYKKFIRINSVVAVLLAGILVLLAFNADDVIEVSAAWSTVVIVGLSLLPGPITLLALWYDASIQVLPIKSKADSLEARAIAGA